MSWQPITTAPADNRLVDLWRRGSRLCNYRRVDCGEGNVFYDPAEYGVTCVRDATHWMPTPDAPA